MEQQKKQRRNIQLLIPLFIVILTLIIYSELIYSDKDDQIPYIAMECRGFGLISGSYELNTCEYKTKININEKGYRGKIHNSKYQLIGDSIIMGIGVNDTQTAASIINIDNLGVPGYELANYEILLNEIYDKEKIFIVSITLFNDMKWQNLLRLNNNCIKRQRRILITRNITSLEKLFITLFTLKEEDCQGQGQPIHQVSDIELMYLDKFLNKFENNRTIEFLNIPSAKGNTLQSDFIEICKKYKLKCHFFPYKESNYYKHDGHLTPEGNLNLAKYINESIING